MATIMEGFTAYRSKEPFVLDAANNVCIASDIAQYLTGYQLNGIVQLYKNFHESGSTILNDEHGLGKRVQVATFIGVICKSNSNRVIIFCLDKKRATEWCYHLAAFAPSVKTEAIDVATLRLSVMNLCPTPGGLVYVTTFDNLRRDHTAAVDNLDCDLLVLDEGQQFCTPAQIHLFEEIAVKRKIIMGSGNIMMNINHFFDVLKYCDVLDTFSSSKAPRKVLSYYDFLSKFGSYCNKTLSTRDQNLRITNILNLCRKFYLRRQRQRIPNNLPLIDQKVCEENMERWQRSKEEQENKRAKEVNGAIDTIPQTSIGVDEDDNENLNSAQVFSQDIFAISQPLEYDADSEQMSPLIYSCSDSEEENKNYATADTLSDHTETRLTPDIVDSSEISNGQTLFQLISLMTDNNEEELQPASPRITRSKKQLENSPVLTRSQRAANPRAAHKYQQLDIQTTNASGRSRNSKRPTGKSSNKTSTDIETQAKKMTCRRYSSEVVCLSHNQLSPIYVPDSSESVFLARIGNRQNPIRFQSTKENHLDQEESSRGSPDLFAGFNDSSFSHAGHGDVVNTSAASRGSTRKDNKTADKISNGQKLAARNAFNDSNDLNQTSDIFEITKNNVFHNLLRVRSDSSVTPVTTDNRDNHKSPAKMQKSCFDGVRLSLPRLRFNINDGDIPMSNKTVFRKTPAVNASKKLQIIEISDSEQSEAEPKHLSVRRSLEIAFEKVSDPKQVKATQLADGERTPPRRGITTTPTTRSCLRRTTEERMARSGWLSKRKSSKNDAANEMMTPTSRRRLEMIGESAHTSKNNEPIIKPRSLFEARASRRVTRSQSLGFSERIIIMSSDDE